MKKDRQVEPHRTVKNRMRLLARLYMIFRDQKCMSTPSENLMDLNIRANLDFLYDAYY